MSGRVGAVQLDLFGDPLEDVAVPFNPPPWCQASHVAGGNRYQCNRPPHDGDLHVDGHGAAWTDQPMVGVRTCACCGELAICSCDSVEAHWVCDRCRKVGGAA